MEIVAYNEDVSQTLFRFLTTKSEIHPTCIGHISE